MSDQVNGWVIVGIVCVVCPLICAILELLSRLGGQKARRAADIAWARRHDNKTESEE